MTKVFISHRGADTALATKLANALKVAKFEVWLDKWEVRLGDSIVSKMNVGLGESGALLLCLSEHGLSPWMDAEWMSALARQLNGDRVRIIPVLLENGTLPAILADRVYVDLSRNLKEGINQIIYSLS